MCNMSFYVTYKLSTLQVPPHHMIRFNQHIGCVVQNLKCDVEKLLENNLKGFIERHVVHKMSESVTFSNR
jgi:hypothetical protein